MANENSVSNDFCSTFIESINVFDCRLSGAGSIFIKYNKLADHSRIVSGPVSVFLFLVPSKNIIATSRQRSNFLSCLLEGTCHFFFT